MKAYADEPNQKVATEHIRDELVTLMAAGHETTVMALDSAFILLSRNPAVGRRLQEEAQIRFR